MDHPPSIQWLDDQIRRVFGDRLGPVFLNGWSVTWTVKTDRYYRVTGAEVARVCSVLDIQPASLEFWDVNQHGGKAIEFSADLDEATPLLRTTRAL